MNAAIRTLTAADVPAAMRIGQAAGWNQTAADWHKLLTLAPGTCFALEDEGVLAATTTAICYGQRLAWIGMVLTDPAYRRRGFARMLLEHAISALIARGVDWMQLDATEMGEPLYRQLGFQAQCGIERWGRTAGASSHAPVSSWHDEWRSFDRDAFGASRWELLEALAPHGASGIPGRGFAMARPGARSAYFGPCVCLEAETAGVLLDWFLHRHADQPVTWDLLPANRAAIRLASDYGFAPQRQLVRMALPGRREAPPLAVDHARIFAIAGFEYG